MWCEFWNEVAQEMISGHKGATVTAAISASAMLNSRHPTSGRRNGKVDKVRNSQGAARSDPGMAHASLTVYVRELRRM